MALKTSKKENCEALTEEFKQLRSEAVKQGLSDKQFHEIVHSRSPWRATQVPEGLHGSKPTLWERLLGYFSDPAHRLHITVVMLAASVGLFVACYELLFEFVVTTPCLIDSNVFTEEMYRPRVNCGMCRDVVSVPQERDISQDVFYEKYAFTGRPVLVKEAIANWTAMSHFSFKFFQKLYRETPGALSAIQNDCQFFGYETEFLTLADALNMSDERAAFQAGESPWYIGWSNCHGEVGKKLRKHYQRPYFLPTDSETVAEDWIFMGGPGPGASIHLDYVERPSWQAQISGQKTWQLVPSAECAAVCHSFNVTVHKGDIIVLDTNIWYHSTFVHPGEISITIGSEFD